MPHPKPATPPTYSARPWATGQTRPSGPEQQGDATEPPLSHRHLRGFPANISLYGGNCGRRTKATPNHLLTSCLQMRLLLAGAVAALLCQKVWRLRTNPTWLREAQKEGEGTTVPADTAELLDPDWPPPGTRFWG